MPSFLSAVSALRAAAEPTRLRMLALLARAELTVGEIGEVIGQSQPRVSRHLKLLCDAGLLDRFREQLWVYYRAPASGEARDTVWQLLALVDEEDDVLRRDRRKMEEVIAERGRRAADQLADDEEPLKTTSDLVDATVVEELASEPIGALLDVGTGSGHILKLLGAKATRAVGVDLSSEALKVARTKVHGAGLSHCELQRGDMYDLPFAAPLFDTVVAERVLAEAERPLAALAEIARTLKHGGRAVIIEDFDSLIAASPANPIATLREWFGKVGLEVSRVRPVDTEAGHLLVAIGRRVARSTAAA
ncbi:ArsR/SmtB family transcription factor [Steroidobacter sp.]|uniref:ArsR/SmtB family transcription factor n=1 Tax=Steroidobacter sp. TaxID=1978227 RepID=UPI001A5FE319|nr:metalloregulator ArsR/SmtB family transcription factor [Steroidobacter sp.]MBL8265676.1 metalloregulator ArsR/SmtB family transcription factor [Steroidobacter sp.]